MRKNSLLLLLLCILPLSAQNVEKEKSTLLAEIEKNNTTLAALRQKVIADKETNNLDKALPDPSFDFSNTWGNQPQSVTSQSYSIEQELDWGTLSGLRNKTRKSENKIVDFNYLLARQSLLAEADQLIVQLTYSNALCEELSMREERSANLKYLYEKKFSAGDADQLELNKVRLSYTSSVAELRQAKAERDEILENLQRLNGNHPINYLHTDYASNQLPTLGTLLQRAEIQAPQLAIASSTIEREHRRLKLSKTEGLPNLNIGYAGSTAKGDNTNAITIGFDIPLWGNNRRKVKQQRAALTLAEMEKKDVEIQIKATLNRRYNNAYSLVQIAEQFRKELTVNEDISILDQALEAGKLSLIDYLNEISFYYSARTQALEAERDSQLAISEVWNMFR